MSETKNYCDYCKKQIGLSTDQTLYVAINMYSFNPIYLHFCECLCLSYWAVDNSKELGRFS